MTRLKGGLIDRSETLSFTFDGRAFTGHPGDTLASALLASGVRLVGRSFKYHRPRGIFAAGSEEPNALVELRSGNRLEPNTRATVVELHDGLEAASQNRFPSLAFDAMALNDVFSGFLAAGFYYKTFMWPASFWERVYEPAIRRAAGLGRLSTQPDPDAYDKGFLHCDLLVVGAGAAGLAAALTAGRAGASVILADEDFRLGGRLLAETAQLDDGPAVDWVASVEAELINLPNVRIMPRTTVFGVFDHGIYGAVERTGDHLAPQQARVRQVLWRITAARSIIAAGATERHIPFRNNDRPGIMLAGSMRAFANRWAVVPGKRSAARIAVFTNNDDAHRTAVDIAAHGLDVTVIDTRPGASRIGNYELLAGATITDTRGRLGLSAVEVVSPSGKQWLACEALGVSGGWNPNVHLTSHHRGRPVWSELHNAFLPGSDLPPGMAAAGAASGNGTIRAALAEGAQAATDALAAMGRRTGAIALPQTHDEPAGLSPFWHVPGKGRAWVDFQNDVTVKDIALAHQENMRSVEHLKRWTTLGMATDQGKTANVTALAIMSELTGKTIAGTGTTIFRPPYTGVSLSVLGGGDTGENFRPRRLTPTHQWAAARGAVFVEAGPWMRAAYYPAGGESHWRETVEREARAVRSSVGLCDVSTLGKIDVQGSDAGRFLDRIYCNGFASVKVGAVRYGLMLREDGFAFDDGTCARLAEDHYIVTTSTGHAGAVYRHLEFAHQCLWPELDVQLVSITDAWAQIAVAGPKSRELLSRIVEDADLSNDAFPFMACREVTVCGGTKARLFRISFSGELAYEIAVPARFGHALMDRLMQAGADLGVTPYGTEALSILRIEKGHAAAPELNGQTTAQMLGLGRMVSKKKDSIGAVLSRRDGLENDTRRLVGLLPVEPTGRIVSGAHLFALGAAQTLEGSEGWITSSCVSPHVGSSIALGFLQRGDERIGEEVIAANPLEGSSVRLRITAPQFIDAEGGRLRA